MTTDRKLLDITPLAEQKLAEILKGHREEGSLIRVTVSVETHGGVRYSLAIEEEPTQSDLVIEAGDLKLVVHAADAPLMEGAQIDYFDGLMRSGFVIRNPNLPSADHGGCACGAGGCGCGGH